MQNVEAFERKREAFLPHLFREAGVPHQFVGVHLVCLVSAAAVHRQVGEELEAAGEFKLSSQAIVEVGGVDSGEILARTGGVAPVATKLCAYFLSAEAVVNLDRLAKEKCLHLAARIFVGTRHGDDVDIVVKLCSRSSREVPAAFLVESHTVVYVSGNGVVAVDVHGTVGIDTRCAVVLRGVANLVAHGAVINASTEEALLAAAVVRV